MNKKIIVSIIALASIGTSIAISQTYAANTTTKISDKFEHMKKGMHQWQFGSGNHTWLHLWSGMKIRGTGEKPQWRSWLKLWSGMKHDQKFGSGHLFSGEKPEFGSGKKIKFDDREHKSGSWKNNTGKVENITNKIEGFASVLENMSDTKLNEVLVKVETMISKTTKTATLTFLNAIKWLIKENISN